MKSVAANDGKQRVVWEAINGSHTVLFGVISCKTGAVTPGEQRAVGR